MSPALRRPLGVVVLPLALTTLVGCGGDREDGAGLAGGERRGDRAATAHPVRVVAGRGGYAFEPEELRVRPGDTVRFLLVGPEPGSVAFDTVGLPAPQRDYLVSRSLVAGPLLVAPGQAYEVPLDGAPAGVYPFHSVAHARAGMRGEVVVAP